ILKPYTSSSTTPEWLWVQEEPRNQGAWGHVKDRLGAVLNGLGVQGEVRYIGRREDAVPATGTGKVYQAQQRAVVEGPFEGPVNGGTCISEVFHLQVIKFSGHRKAFNSSPPHHGILQLDACHSFQSTLRSSVRQMGKKGDASPASKITLGSGKNCGRSLSKRPQAISRGGHIT
ncbi:hypothetical protein BDN67DRAFT_985851, partial [Paxillus ammoniavirescens]